MSANLQSFGNPSQKIAFLENWLCEPNKLLIKKKQQKQNQLNWMYIWRSYDVLDVN